MTISGSSRNKIILAFETEFGFNLPADYRNFLLATDGKMFESAILKSERTGDLILDCLYGLELQDELNLQFWNREFKDEIPEKSLIIGSDPGGAFFLLGTNDDFSGVWYYDHAYSLSFSNDDENAFKLYADFSSFLSDASHA